MVICASFIISFHKITQTPNMYRVIRLQALTNDRNIFVYSWRVNVNRYGKKKRFCFVRFFFLFHFYFSPFHKVFVMAIASLASYAIHHIAAADILTLAHSLHAFNSIHYAKLNRWEITRHNDYFTIERCAVLRARARVCMCAPRYNCNFFSNTNG